MYKGKLVFAQLSEHLPKEIFAASVARYGGKYPTLTFSYCDQFLCMMFAQLTARSSLRDITTCLRSHSAKLYHAGFRGPIARSTLADANERRDCRIFEAFALHLIVLARSLYANEILAQELDQTVYAIDATTIDLCLGLFAWAPAANARAGIKVHTSLDLRGNIPAFIRITGSLVLYRQRLASAALALLHRFKLADPAPDGAFAKLHVFADLADTQALDFDHLRYLQLEAGIKGSSGFFGVHFCRHLGLEKPIVVSF